MKNLMFCSGIICLLLATLGLIGFLPFDIWASVVDIFIGRPEGAFYKIVPSENSGLDIFVLVIIGVSLILLSRLNLKRTDSS